MISVLVTGCAGFIGFHLSRRLMELGHSVLGLDNLSPFYDDGLKAARLNLLNANSNFKFVKGDLADSSCIGNLFRSENFGPIVHLAAQAGVRYSIENPDVYVKTNMVGFSNLIEAAAKRKVPHLLYASSSSVYGANERVPFSENDMVDRPLSLYAATKKSNELTAHVYAHLYSLPVTGVRLFTVYGPWGRPDMALFKFTRAILCGEPIEMYNNGQMRRDFTYIDDVVEGLIRLLQSPPARELESAAPPYRIFNLGNHQPVELATLIRVLEEKIGRKATLKMFPMQPGDVPITYADNDELFKATGYRPTTPIEVGVGHFVDWFRTHYVC
jgi:UDP-glucuronate 4-epimerase